LFCALYANVASVFGLSIFDCPSVFSNIYYIYNQQFRKKKLKGFPKPLTMFAWQSNAIQNQMLRSVCLSKHIRYFSKLLSKCVICCL
jgi:hypothetical protein